MAKAPKLNDLQMILLSTASAREDGNVFPVADSIKDKTAEVAKASTPLLKRALVIEQLETVLVRAWREDSEQRVGLAITDAGRALVDGVAADPGSADVNVDGDKASDDTLAAPRSGSKAAAVLALLQRGSGATLAELIAETGWLPHTTRAALTGLRKKGHAIERGKRGEETCYSIAAKA